VARAAYRLLAGCRKSLNKSLTSVVIVALETGLWKSELLGLTGIGSTWLAA
jgi:hypothetical protein